MVSEITPDSILASWPTPAPRIDGEPTLITIRELQKYLRGATRSIPSKLGGGRHGHLGLIVSDTTYQATAGQVFAYPEEPAADPVLPAGATGPLIAELRIQHQRREITYHTCQSVMTAARTIIIQAVDPIYLLSFEDATEEYSHLTPMQLLTHLSDAYGRLYPNQLEEIRRDMTKDWNPSDPFEVVIHQIETGATIAEASGKPFSSDQIVDCGYILVHKTGLYNDECKLWRRRPVNDQTWTNFKAQFLQAARERKIDQQATAGANGFGTANHVAQQTALALDELAVATNSGFSKYQSENTDLRKQVEKLTALVTAMQANQTTTTATKKPLSGSYCHTHGFLVAAGHNSVTCKKPGPDHKTEATATNRMGGSDRGEPNA